MAESPSPPVNDPLQAYTVPTNMLNQDALCCTFARDFVFIGGLENDQGDRYSVRWNAIGDVTDWPTPATDDARSKQSGVQSFSSEHGWVTGLAGNDFYVYVFQERAITKGTYVGGDVVWSFDTFEEDRGCVRMGRLVQVDDAVFFESERGAHVLENDQITDIGFGQVDDTYF